MNKSHTSKPKYMRTLRGWRMAAASQLLLLPYAGRYSYEADWIECPKVFINHASKQWSHADVWYGEFK